MVVPRPSPSGAVPWAKKKDRKMSVQAMQKKRQKELLPVFWGAFAWAEGDVQAQTPRHPRVPRRVPSAIPG